MPGVDFYYFYETSLSHGLLPKWLLFVAAISIGNSIQAYATLKYTQRVYTGEVVNRKVKQEDGFDSISRTSPVTSLSARTFGTWTFLSSIVRLYAALHIHDPLMYQLALWSYGVAFAHFAAEWFYFGTTKWGPGLAGPVVVSTSSLVWMTLVWKDYIP